MTRTIDDLLLPLLRLLGERESTFHEAIRLLAPAYLSQEELTELRDDFVGSPFNSLLACAWENLRYAGFLEAAETGQRLRLTTRARDLLASEPLSISIEQLRRYPEHVAWGEEIAARWTAHTFRELRFEYYSAGRQLLRAGSFSAAPVLLGYAIEFSLKAAFHRIRKQWTKKDKDLVRGSHDLAHLYSRGRKLGLFCDTSIAVDFLKYACDHFSRRYPSGLTRRSEWLMGACKLPTYDDCMLQLDDSLVGFSGDGEESIVRYALFEAAPSAAEELFHRNAFTSSRAATLESEYRSEHHGHCFAALYFGDASKRREFVYPLDEKVSKLQLAEQYRYPKPGEPDPDPVLALAEQERHRHFWFHYAEWVPKRISDAFGTANVRLVEHRWPKGAVSIYVFDRGAKKWWRELAMGTSRNDLRWMRNAQTEAYIARWISDTKRQFRSRSSRRQ